MNNVETWVMPLAATNQYQQYYANLQSQSTAYIQYSTPSAKPDFFGKIISMVEMRDAVDKLYKGGVIDHEDYKRILNNIRLEELKEDFE